MDGLGSMMFEMQCQVCSLFDFEVDAEMALTARGFSNSQANAKSTREMPKLVRPKTVPCAWTGNKRNR